MPNYWMDNPNEQFVGGWIQTTITCFHILALQTPLKVTSCMPGIFNVILAAAGHNSGSPLPHICCCHSCLLKLLDVYWFIMIYWSLYFLARNYMELPKFQNDWNWDKYLSTKLAWVCLMYNIVPPIRSDQWLAKESRIKMKEPFV